MKKVVAIEGSLGGMTGLHEVRDGMESLPYGLNSALRKPPSAYYVG